MPVNSLTRAALVVGLVVTGAGISYAAIENDWATALVGPYYNEIELEAAVDDASDLAQRDGYAAGNSAGKEAGYVVGYADGSDDGYGQGYNEGSDDGYREGSSQGWDDGYSDGYEQGWNDGCQFLFDGLGTDRVGNWWDYYNSPAYASYYNTNACSF